MIRVAAIVFSSPGLPAAGDWVFGRLAGLVHVERLLASLARAGIAEVRLVADPALGSRLSQWLETLHRRPAPRATVYSDICELTEPAGAPMLVVDGARLYDQAWLNDVVRRADAGEFVVGGCPSGLRVAPDGAALDVTWAGFERPVPGIPALVVPDGAWSAAIDSEAGRRRARELLRRSLAKPTDGWFSRTLNRPVSTRISMRLAPFGVHPDLVTVLTLGVAVASAYYSALGTWAGFALGGVLFQLASVLDGVDGELARLRFAASARGQWLDTVCDDLSNVLYLAGVTVGVAQAGYPDWLVTAGLAAVVLDIVTVAVMYWHLVARGEGTLLAFEGVIERPAFSEGWLGGFARRLQPCVKRDAYAYVFMLAALAGAPWVPLVVTPPALLLTLAGFARVLVVLRGSEA